MEKEKLIRILEGFKNKKVMVLGDMIADEYIFGKTSRVSREAPVLILKYDSTEIILGGAANSVNNIHSMGGRVFPVGMIGQDSVGRQMLRIMREMKIPTSRLISELDRPTITKTRIMAGGYHTARQQVIRIDKEADLPLSQECEARIIRILTAHIPDMDAVLVSDYQAGLITERMRDILLSLVHKYHKPLIVDSRFHVLKYAGATLVTPNETEAAPAVGMSLDSAKGVKEIGLKLLEKIQGKGVLITQGRNGMTLFEGKNKITHIDIIGSDEAVDVTGASDTVASCATLALAAGSSMLEAAYLANYAVGVVVMKRGTAVATVEEVKNKLTSE
ncbi:MAG: bifunctional hydroxymethylpyrimidine kinase/phosphomethylpyrimidine kinase [Elusimicrobia bacterium]|nr:bifunctional hydroxymethylpyrimidine kinase/phosphomethylpyrimidine kinase [Elusimicrobiota bacterium]